MCWEPGGSPALISYFRIPKDIAQLDLSVESPPRQDVLFMKKVNLKM
jgi:hypothetical protein